jgi:hypothetical protein
MALSRNTVMFTGGKVPFLHSWKTILSAFIFPGSFALENQSKENRG